MSVIRVIIVSEKSSSLIIIELSTFIPIKCIDNHHLIGKIIWRLRESIIL